MRVLERGKVWSAAISGREEKTRRERERKKKREKEKERERERKKETPPLRLRRCRIPR